jgi:methionyl-tRNA formyltransferase
MKVAVISNSELCMPLLHYLKLNQLATVLYLGSYPVGTDVSSLISFCKNNSIAIEVEKNSVQLFSWLPMQNPDYAFVFGYKKLIDVERLGEFKNRVFNIHPGRLPQYRGASPIFWQLKNGEEILGITIHFLNESYDAGKIVWSREIRNEPHLSYGLAELIFSNVLIEGVRFILSCSVDQLEKQKIVQDERLAATYKKPTLNNVLINWKTMHANDVVNLVRACNPWNKGAITVYNGMEVKIIDAEVAGGEANESPGKIISVSDGIRVVCAQKEVVKINYLNANGIFVHSRFAEKFGFVTSQSFTSS